MNNITIDMENKFKEDVSYLIEYKNILSDADYGYNIKKGMPLYVFYIKRLDKNFKKEVVKVMTSYIEEIGLENYVYNNIGNWSINYENEIEKLKIA